MITIFDDAHPINRRSIRMSAASIAWWDAYVAERDAEKAARDARWTVAIAEAHAILAEGRK